MPDEEYSSLRSEIEKLTWAIYKMIPLSKSPYNADQVQEPASEYDMNP